MAVGRGDNTALRVTPGAELTSGENLVTSILQGATQRVVVAGEVDEYFAAIPGVYLDVVRTGIGFGPNTVRSAEVNGLSFASGAIGFPLLGRTDIADTHIAVASIRAAPSGSQWCGMAIKPGTLLVYGPGARHTAVSLAGTKYEVALLELESLRKTADEMEMPLHTPARGSVRQLHPGAREHYQMNAVMVSVGDLLVDDSLTPWNADLVSYAALRAFSADVSQARRHRGRGRIDSQWIVERCVEYTDQLRRIPSIRELCGVAHVSERWLRHAFVEMLGCPPLTYFRRRLMNEARRRLLAADTPRTVSSVAMDLGFTHLGRFAAAYKQLFDEAPSESLSRLAVDSA
jgi:AraC-like DNA-binding protein